MDYFFELFGPVTVKRGDICSGAGDAAQETDFGDEESHDVFDLLNAKNVILWGKNAAVSNVHLQPVLRDAKRKGTQVILVDPVRHRSEKLADRFIAPRPGGDFDLAMGVAARLFETRATDPAAPVLLRSLRRVPRARALPQRRAWAAPPTSRPGRSTRSPPPSRRGPARSRWAGEWAGG